MNELYHHGIKGQKWGVRRYQNPDGSLTAAGKRRRAVAIIASPGGYALYKGGKAISQKVKAAKARKEEIANYTDEQKHDIANDVQSSARDTYKYRKYLSDQELNHRLNRLYNEKRLSELAKEEDPTNKYKEAVGDLLVSYGAVKTSSAALGPEAAAFVAASKIINAPPQNKPQKQNNSNDAYMNYINSEKRNDNNNNNNYHKGKKRN